MADAPLVEFLRVTYGIHARGLRARRSPERGQWWDRCAAADEIADTALLKT